MLVFMYLVVKGESTDQSFLAFLLTGSAMFLFIRMILQGAGFAVVEDREHYRILRYIYIAPVPLPIQIAGRITIKLVVSFVGMIATFSAGYLFLKIPFRPDGIQWDWFSGSLALGLVGLLAMGWILASMMLLVDRMGWVWAEGFAGLMFLAAGAIIPLALLPAPMAWVGKILPMTYWADIWRHAIYGDLSALAQPGLTMNYLWSWMLGTTVVWSIAAVVWYRLCDSLARKWGRVERETFY